MLYREVENEESEEWRTRIPFTSSYKSRREAL